MEVWHRADSHYIVCSKKRHNKRFRYSITYVDETQPPEKKIRSLLTTVQAPEIVQFKLCRSAIKAVVDSKTYKCEGALLRKFLLKVEPFADPIWINQDCLSSEAFEYCCNHVQIVHAPQFAIASHVAPAQDVPIILASAVDLPLPEESILHPLLPSHVPSPARVLEVPVDDVTIPFPSYADEAHVPTFPSLKNAENTQSIVKGWNERVYFGDNMSTACNVHYCISCDERHFYADGVVKKISEAAFIWDILRDEAFDPAQTCTVRHDLYEFDDVDIAWSKGLAVSLNGMINKSDVFFCRACFNVLMKEKIPPFSLKNNFYQKPTPDALRDLTWSEQALISPYRMCITITKLRPMLGIHNN
jgi:hypothetical protein